MVQIEGCHHAGAPLWLYAMSIQNERSSCKAPQGLASRRFCRYLAEMSDDFIYTEVSFLIQRGKRFEDPSELPEAWERASKIF